MISDGFLFPHFAELFVSNSHGSCVSSKYSSNFRRMQENTEIISVTHLPCWIANKLQGKSKFIDSLKFIVERSKRVLFFPQKILEKNPKVSTKMQENVENPHTR